MYYCSVNEPRTPHRALNGKRESPGIGPQKRGEHPIEMPTCLKPFAGSRKVSVRGGKENLITSE